MTWKRRLLDVLNRGLDGLGLALVPSATTRWWTVPERFAYRGREYPYFRHAVNCGWPPHVTERAVELALADAWLDAVGSADVLEIGAVTPYVWPRRVGRIVDPHDPHPRVTDRRSVLDLDLRGETVLSISTLEHVGRGEYGPDPRGSPTEALEKVLRESTRALVTVPIGVCETLDTLLLADASLPAAVERGFLIRGPHGTWHEAPAAQARLPYGDADLQRRFPETRAGHWARAVVILRQGADVME